MTLGQERALRELERLHSTNPDAFKFYLSAELLENRLIVVLDLLIGPIETKEGGLDLREREEFIVSIPPGFPFDRPTISVSHGRFAGFPHVIWSKTLCLYQTQNEWNPADGLYGFFERLKLWIKRAAVKDMDPIEGPLEPPHHVTDFSQVPFIIRENAPVQVGETWFGVAELEKHSNRIELVGWNDLSGSWPEGREPALAIFLPQNLPMEFPERGADFFKELNGQGLDRNRILKHLAIASILAKEDAPIHLILGIPKMRRAADGTPKFHVAVWSTSPEFVKSLRLIIPKDSDSQELAVLRDGLADSIYKLFESQQVKWCRVLETRSEIIIHRDHGSPISWFEGKKVLILGCGALGSWAAETIARARPNNIHLVDNGIVKPGLLARQNYVLEDIGVNKAKALSVRVQSIDNKILVEHFNQEAHSFAIGNRSRFESYDVVVDCTASSIFQMKLERDWHFLNQKTPLIISIIIDAEAQRSLCVVVDKNSFGGIWDAFIRLKLKICNSEMKEIASKFYSSDAAKALFQPEPGCSDLTYIGSTADVSTLVNTALNVATRHITNAPIGIAFRNYRGRGDGKFNLFHLSKMQEASIGNYKVRIDASIFKESFAWVKQNTRLYSKNHETGGLLWGLWDDAVQVIWVFDVSGPPPDSLHDPGHFVCGIHGTVDEHHRRMKQSFGSCGFVGFWHTHPNMPSRQSGIDIAGMAKLVSSVGDNQRRSLMFIYGRNYSFPTLGIYVYESNLHDEHMDFISIGEAQMQLKAPVV